MQVLEVLSTHLLYILQYLKDIQRGGAHGCENSHHVTVAVKGFDASEQFLVVPQGNEDLSIVAHGLLEDGERPLRNLVLLEGP